MYVWISLRQGLYWVQRSLRKGTQYALRTRLSASCMLMVGVWRAQIVGSKFYFLTLKSMCVFTLVCVITLMVKPLKAAAWPRDSSTAQKYQQGPGVPAQN